MQDHAIRSYRNRPRPTCIAAAKAAGETTIADNESAFRSDPLHFRTLTDVAALIRSRDISPVELTRTLIDRIDALDTHLHSYLTVSGDRALEAARSAEREIESGRYRGTLHGIPVAVKDLCYTKDTRTTAGLSFLRDFVPDFDATVVSKLESAGAIVIGKTNLTEGAMAGYHRAFPIPVNPWDPSYWPGASSSGSGVAVSAGLCFAALGTDTGGSIRVPAMCNGIVGLKPTYGRVSRYGVLALGESFDHVGPLTRSTADAAVVFEAIAGHDENDSTSLTDAVPDMLAGIEAGVAGMRIGIDRPFCFDGTDPELVAAIETALTVLSDLGAAIVDVEMPGDKALIEEIFFTMCPHETARAHAVTYPSRADEYGAFFRDFLASGSAITEDQYAAASEKRVDYAQRFDGVLGSVDAIACTAGGTNFRVVPDAQYGNAEDLQTLFDSLQIHHTIPANLAGVPTLTVPCGFSGGGIPYGLQLIGRRLSEAPLCRIGQAYEQATDWHTRHPAL